MKVSTISSWKSEFPWFFCKHSSAKTCISQKSINGLKKYYNPVITSGCTRLKWSVLADHESDRELESLSNSKRLPCQASN